MFEPGFPDRDDLRLMAYLHGDFPLVDEPYAAVAAALGLDELGVLARLRRLLDEGWLTRFGPLFQIERAGGQFVLAALPAPTTPPERFEALAARVNAHVEVAHNYRREHPHLTMWFVVAARSPAAATAVLDAIETETGLPVHRFPKLREFFVELRLPLEQLGSEVAAC